MSENKHTPTPWEIGWAIVDEYEQRFICIAPSDIEEGGTGEMVCLMSSEKNYRDIDKINAEHIVHCVNSHASLLTEISNLKRDKEELRDMLKNFVDSAYASNTYGFINEAKELLKKITHGKTA